jgi:hypothetical protein
MTLLGSCAGENGHFSGDIRRRTALGKEAFDNES